VHLYRCLRPGGGGVNFMFSRLKNRSGLYNHCSTAVGTVALFFNGVGFLSIYSCFQGDNIV
jgi:hypothetical protein